MTAAAKAGRLTRGLPSRPPAEELIDALCERPGLRIERIVSTGQITPDGHWYDQDHDEWVLVVKGATRLRIEGETVDRELEEGDYTIWARVIAPTGNTNSFYVTLNGELVREWHISETAEWAWRRVIAGLKMRCT